MVEKVDSGEFDPANSPLRKLLDQLEAKYQRQVLMVDDTKSQIQRLRGLIGIKA